MSRIPAVELTSQPGAAGKEAEQAVEMSPVDNVPADIAALEITGWSLDVTWADGTVTSLPHLWLRDNCWCNECRVAQTTEKAFRVTSVSVDIAPNTASLSTDQTDGQTREVTIELVWPDGHQTSYPAAWIREISQPSGPWSQAWPVGFRPRETDWSAFIDDDAAAAAMIEDFLVTGAALLTDAPREPNALEDLAPRLGPLHEVLFERIHNVELNPQGYNIAHTTLELPPHNDMASYRWPPSVQVLHFLANETAGGESVIVDSWAVLADLRAEHPDMFEALCTMPVPFRQFDDQHETFATSTMVRLDADGNVESFRYSNQLMQPMNPTRPGVAEFYRAYHELSRRLLDPAAEAVFRVEGGQALVIAAHRVLHARKEFVPNGRRHLQDAYFEHDNVRNHLTVLRRRASLNN